MKRLSLLLTVILAMLCGQRVSAQENSGQVDSLVSLLSAKSLRQVEENGIQYRKVIGPARFFHNNTYLICDTAYWFLNTEIIDAIGNVKILQNETVLTGDSLRYIVNSDLAQFRGHLVQLEDKDHNVLRTRHLDYNTKDSVAVFNYGGALKDAEEHHRLIRFEGEDIHILGEREHVHRFDLREDQPSPVSYGHEYGDLRIRYRRMEGREHAFRQCRMV